MLIPHTHQKLTLAAVGLFLLLLVSPAIGQVTYWWQQMNRKPDARRSQEFFFVPGTNIWFTYTNNRVVINAGGGSGNSSGLTTNIAVVFGNGSTNTLVFTNGSLAAIIPLAAHGPSIILPGGGYLLQPGGGSYLLP